MNCVPAVPTDGARTPVRRALACACLALLGSCSLGPRYHRPAIAPPAAWRDPSAATAATWPSSDWWHGFHSAQLDQLLDEARHANDDLAAAVARVREADAQRRIAGAPLLPSVSVGANATRQRAPVTGVGPETYDQFVPLLTVGYELDFWGKNRATRTAASASAASSRYDRATVELTVMASVASSYFQALELRDRLAVAEQNLKDAQHILDGLRLEQKVGTATGLDVAQQETAVATLYASIPALEQALRQDVDALAILVGKMPEDLDVTSGSLDELNVPDVAPGLPSELLARRPDVAEAEAQLMAANANMQVARASLFPSITLTGSGGYESSALATLLRPASQIWSIGAGLTQPIFEGGALRGQVELSRARYDELLAGYHKAVISAFANAEDSLVALRQTSEQVNRQQQAVNQARRAYRFAETQMRAGVINVLTLLNAQAALLTAEDTLAQVKFAHLQASVNLFKALGGGWQPGGDGSS